MRYSTNRTYRDCMILEVEKLLKKIDETENKRKKGFIEKIIEFIKRILKK
jgi:hypothetical protein